MHWLKAASCATIWLDLWKDFHFDFHLSLIWTMKSCFYTCKRRRKKASGVWGGKYRESSSGFTGAAGTRKTILEQHKTKVMQGQDLSSESAPKFLVSPVQGTTNSAQLRRNLKEPKIAGAETPRCGGSGASAAPVGQPREPLPPRGMDGTRAFPPGLCWKVPAQKIGGFSSDLFFFRFGLVRFDFFSG